MKNQILFAPERERMMWEKIWTFIIVGLMIFGVFTYPAQVWAVVWRLTAGVTILVGIWLLWMFIRGDEDGA